MVEGSAILVALAKEVWAVTAAVCGEHEREGERIDRQSSVATVFWMEWSGFL